jgi:hypothetical protein
MSNRRWTKEKAESREVPRFCGSAVIDVHDVLETPRIDMFILPATLLDR